MIFAHGSVLGYCRRRPPGQLLLSDISQVRDREVVEGVLGCDGHSQQAVDLEDDLVGKNRIAAELEEFVEHPDRLHAERRQPDPHDLLLDGSALRHVFVADFGTWGCLGLPPHVAQQRRLVAGQLPEEGGMLPLRRRMCNSVWACSS